jgi:hypothetical protein
MNLEFFAIDMQVFIAFDLYDLLVMHIFSSLLAKNLFSSDFSLLLSSMINIWQL